MIYFLIPVISAIVGAIINRIVISFLYHPIAPKKFLGLTIQGLLPKNQLNIARSVGKFAAKEISLDDIEGKIVNDTNVEKLIKAVDEHVDHFLRVKLKESMPMISMFIGDKTITQFKDTVNKELKEVLPDAAKKYIGDIKQGIDIEEIITSKIASIPYETIENTLRSSQSKLLRNFTLLGALAGFIIGLIQIAIFLIA